MSKNIYIDLKKLHNNHAHGNRKIIARFQNHIVKQDNNKEINKEIP